jgi:hypothetical protein
VSAALAVTHPAHHLCGLPSRAGFEASAQRRPQPLRDGVAAAWFVQNWPGNSRSISCSSRRPSSIETSSRIDRMRGDHVVQEPVGGCNMRRVRRIPGIGWTFSVVRSSSPSSCNVRLRADKSVARTMTHPSTSSRLWRRTVLRWSLVSAMIAWSKVSILLWGIVMANRDAIVVDHQHGYISCWRESNWGIG